MRLPSATAASYSFKDDHDRAIAHYSEAVGLDPRNADTFINRGVVAYYSKKDYDRAIADFEEAIRLKPNFTEAIDSVWRPLRGKAN